MALSHMLRRHKPLTRRERIVHRLENVRHVLRGRWEQLRLDLRGRTEQQAGAEKLPHLGHLRVPARARLHRR
jgi:hypothetical protein